jgi:hypothetical protein
MDKFVVKRDAWHLRVYSVYRAIVDPDSYRYIDTVDKMVETTIEDNRWSYNSIFRDFCTYWRRVLVWPTVNFVFNAGLIVLFFWLVSRLSLNGVGAGLAVLGIFVAMLAVFVTVVGAIFGIYWVVRNVVFDNIPDDNIFARAHDAYKNKYCPMVELEKKEGEADVY